MPLLFPRVLVVIMMTPSLAREPYKAAAVAPLRMVMLSMSSGLMLESPSPPSEVLPPPRTPMELSAAALPGLVPKLVLSMGTPLTTISGLFCPEMEDCPRMRILEVPAGPVPKPEMFTPATLPCRVFIKLGERFSVRASPPTVVVAYPNFFDSLRIPRAVTTISPNSSTAASIETVIWVRLPTYSSTVVKPVELKERVSVLRALMLNLPSMSVTAPVVVPLISTSTPGMP